MCNVQISLHIYGLRHFFFSFCCGENSQKVQNPFSLFLWIVQCIVPIYSHSDKHQNRRELLFRKKNKQLSNFDLKNSIKGLNIIMAFSNELCSSLLSSPLIRISWNISLVSVIDHKHSQVLYLSSLASPSSTQQFISHMGNNICTQCIIIESMSICDSRVNICKEQLHNVSHITL